MIDAYVLQHCDYFCCTRRPPVESNFLTLFKQGPAQPLRLPLLSSNLFITLQRFLDHPPTAHPHHRGSPYPDFDMFLGC